MKVNPDGILDLVKADNKLRAWKKCHNTPAKVAAAHRKVLLERVSQSMAFEDQPVSADRLKVKTSRMKTGSSGAAANMEAADFKTVRFAAFGLS